jgi:hypothetical protein
VLFVDPGDDANLDTDNLDDDHAGDDHHRGPGG